VQPRGRCHRACVAVCSCGIQCCVSLLQRPVPVSCCQPHSVHCPLSLKGSTTPQFSQRLNHRMPLCRTVITSTCLTIDRVRCPLLLCSGRCPRRVVLPWHRVPAPQRLSLHPYRQHAHATCRLAGPHTRCAVFLSVHVTVPPAPPPRPLRYQILGYQVYQLQDTSNEVLRWHLRPLPAIQYSTSG
jgi:hypothetical protein